MQTALPSWRNPWQRLVALWTETHESLIDRNLRFDYRPLVVLVAVAVSLTVQEYIGSQSFFVQDLTFIPIEYRGGPYKSIWSLAWWSGWRIVGYLLFPMVVLRCMGERIRDYGWSFKGFWDHKGLYLVLYLLVLVLVYIMSLTKHFQQTYPFYKLANRSTVDLVAWELLYAAQFFSLEFFFRGFMLFALRRSLGIYAIFVMVVPYNMIHYGKPMTECLAAIVAGLVLGTIALRTKSIWGGIFIHAGIGLSMDLLTVGYLPHR